MYKTVTGSDNYKDKIQDTRTLTVFRLCQKHLQSSKMIGTKLKEEFCIQGDYCLNTI